MRLNRRRIAGSIALLILLGASTARSAQDEHKDQKPAAAPAAPQAAVFSDDASDDSSCLSDPSVLSEINKKKQELDQKERDLQAKTAELNAREAAIGDEMKKLQSLRDEISGIQSARKKENAAKVDKIVATLEGMSPKAAAQMLTDLDDGLAVSAIAQMSTVKLSKIMNALPPERAAKLTELLAGVVRASHPSASNGATATTNLAKGGESNDQQHIKQPQSIISGGPEQFAGRDPASAGQGPAKGN